MTLRSARTLPGQWMLFVVWMLALFTYASAPDPGNYFSHDQFVCVARNFTADKVSSNLDVAKKVSSCVDIFCFEGRRNAVLNAFAKIQIIFTFPHQRSPTYHVYHGTHNEVVHAYIKQKGSRWSFTSVLPSIPIWKLLGFGSIWSYVAEGLWSWSTSAHSKESFQLSPSETSCVGIDTMHNYVLTFSNQWISLPLLLGYVSAIFLWIYSNRLAPNSAFQYCSGTGTGMLLFVILILVYVSRRVPKKAYALSGFISIFSASIFAWFFNTVTTTIRSIATHHPLLIASYFIFTGFVSFVFIWWYGPITNPRSVQAFSISLRGLSMLMLLWCSNSPELSVVAIVLLLLNDGRKFIFEVPLFNRIWLRTKGWLGIKTTSREGLISSEEFEIEASVYTAQALAELKEQLNGSEWKKLKNKVRDQRRLANFVFGSDDHVAPAEKEAHNELVMLADQFYGDEPPEESDIEDNVAGGSGQDDPDSGDVSMASTSSYAQNRQRFSNPTAFFDPRRQQQPAPTFQPRHQPPQKSDSGLYPPLDHLHRNFDFANRDTPPLPKRIAQHQRQQQHNNLLYGTHGAAFMQNAAVQQPNAARNAFNVPPLSPSEVTAQRQREYNGSIMNCLTNRAGNSRPVFGQRPVPSAPNGNDYVDDDDDDDDDANGSNAYKPNGISVSFRPQPSSRVATFAAHYGPSTSSAAGISPLQQAQQNNNVSFRRDGNSSSTSSRKRQL